MRHFIKSDVLKMWLEDEGIDLAKLKFVIFDDDEREGFQNVPDFKSNFIKTNPEHGITDEDVKNAVKLLS